MTISASDRTKIPAFYADWFLRQVSFAFEDVEGFVFWTENLAPFKIRL